MRVGSTTAAGQPGGQRPPVAWRSLDESPSSGWRKAPLDLKVGDEVGDRCDGGSDCCTNDDSESPRHRPPPPPRRHPSPPPPPPPPPPHVRSTCRRRCDWEDGCPLHHRQSHPHYLRMPPHPPPWGRGCRLHRGCGCADRREGGGRRY